MPESRSFAMTQRRCREAIELAERYGWGAEPVIAPALMTLAGSMVCWVSSTRASGGCGAPNGLWRTDTGPDIRLLLHQTAGMLHAGRGRHREALEEFGAAEELGSQLAGSQALASQVTGWLLATQARLGLTGQARAALAALDDERASSGEIRNARAVICLAEGDPAAALPRSPVSWTAWRRSSGTSRSWRRTCWPGSPTVSSATSARRTRPPNGRWPWPRPTGWSCRSR